MISFREGEVTLLYIPFDISLTDDQQKQVEHILFTNRWDTPQWSEYNAMFEGYIIEDFTEESDCHQMITEDDHMEAYFEIKHVHEDISQMLREVLGRDDVMLCTGLTGFCDLELAS